MENREFRMYEKPINLQVSPVVYDSSTTLNKRLQHRLFQSLEIRPIGWTIVGIYEADKQHIRVHYSICNKEDRFIKKIGYEEALKNKECVIISVSVDDNIYKLFKKTAKSVINYLEKKKKLRV